MKKHIFEQLTKLVYDDVVEESILDPGVVRPKRKHCRLNFNFLLQQFDLDIPIFDMPAVRPHAIRSRLNLSFLQDQFVVYPTPLPTLISFMSKFHAPWGGQQ